MKCSFNGCVKDAFSKGLCGSHYAQQRQGKELKPLQQQFHGLGEKERFEKRVADHPTGCKVWLGSIQMMQNRPKADWHGQWRNAAGERELTHRAAYRMYKGPIVQGAFVLHTCDNPRCVNTDHLFVGTADDNSKDSVGKLRHAYGMKNRRRKMDEEAVKAIRAFRGKHREIADRFGVTQSLVSMIRARKIWRYV